VGHRPHREVFADTLADLTFGANATLGSTGQSIRNSAPIQGWSRDPFFKGFDATKSDLRAAAKTIWTCPRRHSVQGRAFPRHHQQRPAHRTSQPDGRPLPALRQLALSHARLVVRPQTIEQLGRNHDHD
jgi:hypothetical protein